MGLQQRVRDQLARFVKAELAQFLDENREPLLQAFREELARLDESIPEENVFIDIKMVPLGETILVACLNAFQRFLRDEVPPVPTGI